MRTEGDNATAIPGILQGPDVAVVEEMSAFDALPQPIRRAIASAPFDISAPDALDAIGGGVRPADVILVIRDHNKRALRAAYCERGFPEKDLLAVLA